MLTVADVLHIPFKKKHKKNFIDPTVKKLQ